MTPAGPVNGAPGDERSLRRLSTGYAAAVDTLDGAGFAALFLPEGELWVPDPAAGPDPVICRRGHRSLRRVPSGLARFHATHHRVGRTQLRDRTRTLPPARSIGVAHHLAARTDPECGDAAGTDTVWYLRYADVYVRTEGGWRFERRALHLRGIEERPIPHLGRLGTARVPRRRLRPPGPAGGPAARRSGRPGG